MSSVGSGRRSVDARIAFSVHCSARRSGILVKSDFTSNDTSLQLKVDRKEKYTLNGGGIDW